MGSSIANIWKGAVIEKRIGWVSEGFDINPPRGHAWILLSGYIVHITGTETMLVSTRGEGIHQIYIMIPTGVATMISPLFNVSVQTAGVQAQWSPDIITDADHLHLSGAATAYANLLILDFEM